ncbi:phosphotransferase [Solirubrobacter soli]|uniref:phosphotransferase n=1 Tax=Solirubrobacter soli TaxID=363832 RepID=UPI0003FBFC7E|nr:phosphotransferase [Solirubrobacter soli]
MPSPLERELFGTGRRAELVDAFCRAHLRSGVARREFSASSVGSVHGVRLQDGRRVVVKVYRSDVDVVHLAAVGRVQARLADSGFPAPRPLLAPTPLANGVAVVETLVDRGRWADAHVPAVRRAVAGGLAALLEHARREPGLVAWREAYEQLWRSPHDRRFDFAGTAHGAEWIDELASAARRRLDECADGPVVVGHGDWRVEHLRFADGALSAVYDWDSLAVAPAPVFAGAAAHQFTADWSIEGHACAPTFEESMAFLSDFEAARGTPFSDRERQLAYAAFVAALAYSERCGHSDRLTAFGTRPPTDAVEDDDSILRRHGANLLAA